MLRNLVDVNREVGDDADVGIVLLELIVTEALVALLGRIVVDDTIGQVGKELRRIAATPLLALARDDLRRLEVPLVL